MITPTHFGKDTQYVDQYQPNLLYPIPRDLGRKAMGIANSASLPFTGVDIWNAYELSWLDQRGKPHVAVAEWMLPCTSPNLIESKSIKLYFNSFNMTQFHDIEMVQSTIASDFSKAARTDVAIKLILPYQFQSMKFVEWEGKCIDELSIFANRYLPDANLLAVETSWVEEKLISHLLRSNCPITNQPDWASIFISYKGKKINHAGLLQYIISFRQYNGFHEQCIEKMFIDIMQHCEPEELTIAARYTRRGGIDINPFRTNADDAVKNFRLARQ